MSMRKKKKLFSLSPAIMFLGNEPEGFFHIPGAMKFNDLKLSAVASVLHKWPGFAGRWTFASFSPFTLGSTPRNSHDFSRKIRGS